MLVTAYITLGRPLPERRGIYFETGKMRHVGSESERGHPRVLIQLAATFVTFTFVDRESRFKNTCVTYLESHSFMNLFIFLCFYTVIESSAWISFVFLLLLNICCVV